MTRALAMLALLLCGVAWLTLRPAPPTIVAEAAPQAQPQGTREAWAVDLLGRLGNTQPSADLIAFMVTWTRAEDSGPGALGRNNAYNTTLCLPGRMTGAINGDGACGVQGYATWQDGIEATARTLEQANFAGIRAALLENDAERAKLELWESQWAESRYGHGTAWPKE